MVGLASLVIAPNAPRLTCVEARRSVHLRRSSCAEWLRTTRVHPSPHMSAKTLLAAAALALAPLAAAQVMASSSHLIISSHHLIISSSHLLAAAQSLELAVTKTGAFSIALDGRPWLRCVTQAKRDPSHKVHRHSLARLGRSLSCFVLLSRSLRYSDPVYGWDADRWDPGAAAVRRRRVASARRTRPVRARPGRSSALSVSHRKSVLYGGFCTGAQGA